MKERVTYIFKRCLDLQRMCYYWSNSFNSITVDIREIIILTQHGINTLTQYTYTHIYKCYIIKSKILSFNFTNVF